MRRLAFVLLLLLSSAAHSAAPVYGWQISFNNYPTTVYPSAIAACQAGAQVWMEPRPSYHGPAYLGPDLGNYHACNVYNQNNQEHTIGTVGRMGTKTCPYGGTPDTSKPEAQQCPDDVSCPYGQMKVNGVCANICPVGQHLGRTQVEPLEVNQCLDDCPANTLDTTAIGKLSLCIPKEMETKPPVKTCAADQMTMGFDGEGNAICKQKPPPPDPCPEGTHNISSDPEWPNCTANDGAPDADPKPQSDPNKTTKKTDPVTNTTNPDGSTTSTKKETITFPDGSQQVTTTKITTNPDGTVTAETSVSGNGGMAGKGSAGAGSGTGTGDGKGEGEKEKDETPTPISGDLYQKKDKTFASVLNSFNTTMNNAPMVNGAKNFLSVSVPAGACPQWSGTIPYLNYTVSMSEYFCNQDAMEMFDVARVCVLLLFAYLAFRMAFL